MPLHDLTDFLKLSSSINYNLSAASLNRYNILMAIIGGRPLHRDEQKDRDQKGILMEALSYLFAAYGERRRRLGPLAVIHPLRASALLASTQEELNLIDLLTQMFHDILEDINPGGFSTDKWIVLEDQLVSLFRRIGPRDEQNLIDRMVCLTRLDDESYFQYVWRLFDCHTDSAKLLQVKLADRLDNTLDMRIAIQDPIEGVDFFKNIFQLLFVNTYKGYVPRMVHPPTEPLNGAKRLYQLFKNAVLLSLIRKNVSIDIDQASQILFNAVAEASLMEAQRTFIHISGYHYKDIVKQRSLLLETMEYCFSGKSERVTKPDNRHLLDGLFASYFGQTSSKTRNQKIDELYANKPLMLQSSIAFIAIFLSFLNDPHFYVRGISANGIEPI